MNSRRTYLDALNAGRQRKPETSLEQLSRTLENLERQLEMRERGATSASVAPPQMDDAPFRQQDPLWGRSDPYAEQRDELPAILRSLRDEMRQQLRTGLHQEFDALRQKLEQTYSASHIGSADQKNLDSQSPADPRHAAASGQADKGLDLLRLELEQVKSAISTLAREDTLRSVSARWDDVDRKLSGLRQYLRSAPEQQDVNPALAALRERLDQIGMSVDGLPASLPLERLEKKILDLAKAIDHFSRQQETTRPGSLQAIEGRLEEISRAIVAISMSPHGKFDPRPFERIEARLSALAKQIGHAGQPSDQMLDRLNMLSRRVEEIATSTKASGGAIETLGRQLASLGQKTTAQSSASFRDGILENLERRLADVTKRLDAHPTRSATAGDEAIVGLQQRLDRLTTKMESASDIDPALIRSLESQLGALSKLMANPQGVSAELSVIAPRLDRLEASVAEGRNDILQAARHAAEQAVKTFAGSHDDTAAIAALTQDLKSLERLTQTSHHRNTKTFEAIHETLTRIADRLGTLDTTSASQPVQPAREFDTTETRALDIAEAPLSGPRSASVKEPAAQQPITPATTASSNIDDTTAEVSHSRSVAGPAHWFWRDEAKPAPQGAEPAVDAARSEAASNAAMDPAMANELLEPGSGAPDLGAMIRRIREEREAGEIAAPDVSRSDFIAAARHAAQAAAAEAETLKREAQAEFPDDTAKPADTLKTSKRPILLAATAIVVALAGLQLGKAFVNDPSGIAGVEQKQPVKQATPAQHIQSKNKATGGSASLMDSRAKQPTAAQAASPAEEQIGRVNIPDNAGPLPLREAAQSGDAKALYEIGTRFGDGRGVASNMSAAAEWYGKSARLGFAPAQFRLGKLYEKGLGVGRDMDEAKRWYRLAADQGNVSAMHNLAVLFATDTGKGVDNEAAVRWFSKAAAYGARDSQFNLGVLNAKGIGLPRNLEQSYKWLALVAQSGDRDAAQKRDQIAKSLRPEQIDKALGEIQAWKPEPLKTDANSLSVPESWRESAATTSSIDPR